MNAPRDLGPSFRAWMRQAPPPVVDLETRILKQTRRTRQRRRWLWFLPGRKPTAEAFDEQDDDGPAAPIPRAGELVPEPLRGTRTMFSATNLIAAATVLALSAGIVSSGVLTSEPEAPAGAGADTGSPLWTGDYFDDNDGIVAVTGTGRFGPAPGVITGVLEMSDPRVSGELLAGYQWLCSPNEACTTWGNTAVTNDGGTWEGDFVAINGPAPGHLQSVMAWMNGTGEYEGLSYVVNWVGPMSESIATGKIIAAPLPPQVALNWDEAAAD